VSPIIKLTAAGRRCKLQRFTATIDAQMMPAAVVVVVAAAAADTNVSDVELHAMTPHYYTQ